MEGGGYNFHSKDGWMYLAHGHYVKIEGLDPNPSIPAEQTATLFAEYKEIPKDSVFDYFTELLIKEVPSASNENDVFEPKLVYKVCLLANCAYNDKVGFIDAHTGKVVATEPRVLGYSATGEFETRYNTTRYATTQYYNGEYYLIDSSRVTSGGPVIHTLNLDGDIYFNHAEELTDDDNIWEEFSTNEDDMALDIHWALQEIVDYLNDEHDLNSYDDQGSIVNAYFQYGDSIYEDFIKDRAGYDPNQDEPGIFFGDGYVKYSPIASLDAVAHEYGHMITDALINWEFTGDCLAFHEGLSDIWAVILENRINSNSIWEIGDQICLNDDCIRNIADTHDDDAELEIADTYLSNRYNVTTPAGAVPYIRGGVFSHWFYLLVNGDSGTNGVNDDYLVYGIGMDAAEDLIVAAVVNNYLRETSTYPQIRTLMLDVSDSLYGGNSLESIQVANAWFAVGVGSEPSQINITGPDTVCPSGASFTINNLPSGVSINWTPGPNLSLSSSQGSNPCTFTSTGTGSSWIAATISSSYSSITDTIYVTSSEPTDLGGLYSECGDGGPIGYSCPFWVSPFYSGDSIVWNVSPSADLSYQGYGIANITFNSPGYYTISVYALNDCGEGDPVYAYFYAFQYLMSPNPASNEVEIIIDYGDTDNLQGTNLVKQEYLITISDMYGITQIQKNYSGNRFTVPVNKLKNGNYLVRLKNDKIDLTKQLIISR